MPHLQMIGTEASNAGSSEEAIAETKRRIEETFGSIDEPPTFSSFLGTAIGRDLDGAEKNYVDAVPSAIAEGIRGAVFDALRRGVRIFVQWTPAYDYQVSLWEAGYTARSSGGLIVQISGPYPGADAASS